VWVVRIRGPAGDHPASRAATVINEYGGHATTDLIVGVHQVVDQVLGRLIGGVPGR
jgi:hypothetical protein